MVSWRGHNRPLVIAHRGASTDAPENTMAALELAVAQGADGFEFDVQMTADGVMVLMHDGTVARTTTGRGRVRDLTLKQIQSLHIKNAPAERVPTLAEVLARFGRDVLYNVEVKGQGWRGKGSMTAVGELIHRYGVADQCAVTSFHPFWLREGRGKMPAGVLMGNIRMRGLGRYSYFLFDGEVDHPHHGLVDEAYMRWAKERGYRVHVWTVDEPVLGRKLAQLGVHGLITNKPALMCEALGK